MFFFLREFTFCFCSFRTHLMSFLITSCTNNWLPHHSCAVITRCHVTNPFYSNNRSGSTELACQQIMAKNRADKLKADVTRIIQKNRHKQSNRTWEKKNITTWWLDRLIQIIPADKGWATVLLDKTVYEEKIKALVSDTNTYQQIKSCPWIQPSNMKQNWLGCWRSGNNRNKSPMIYIGDCTQHQKQYPVWWRWLPGRLEHRSLIWLPRTLYVRAHFTKKLFTAIGSPISPIVANLYLEAFEERALERDTNKPEIWLRYVDHRTTHLSSWKRTPTNLRSISTAWTESQEYNIYCIPRY